MTMMWLVAVVSFGTTVAAILLLRPVVIRMRLVDRPGGRKRHIGDVPLVGGLAGFVGSMVVLAALPVHWPAWVPAAVVATGLLLACGMLDDRYDLPPRYRILVQVVAALIVVLGAGVKLENLGDLVGTGTVMLGWLAVPFTVFCFIGVMNGANLLDGANGLAGGASLIAFLAFAIVAGIVNGFADRYTLILLASELAAFLIFNYRLREHAPAHIFLGNGGSLLLGFMLTLFAIDLSQRGGEAVPPITAVWIMGLLIMDTLSVMIRRMARRRHPFAADRSHVHHLLLAAGVNDRYAVALLWLVQTGFAVAGITAWRYRVPQWVMVSGFVALFVTYSLACEFLSTLLHRQAAAEAEAASASEFAKAA